MATRRKARTFNPPQSRRPLLEDMANPALRSLQLRVEDMANPAMLSLQLWVEEAMANPALLSLQLRADTRRRACSAWADTTRMARKEARRRASWAWAEAPRAPAPQTRSVKAPRRGTVCAGRSEHRKRLAPLEAPPVPLVPPVPLPFPWRVVRRSTASSARELTAPSDTAAAA